MKANELMIGDWLLRDGYPMQVNEIKMYSTSGKPTINGWDEEDFEPIKVTYELLIDNCGFGFTTNKTYGKHFYLRPKGKSKIVLYKNSWYDAAVKDSPFHVFHKGLEVKYLHQLQNLIFALTGNEMAVNL